MVAASLTGPLATDSATTTPELRARTPLSMPVELLLASTNRLHPGRTLLAVACLKDCELNVLIRCREDAFATYVLCVPGFGPHRG